MNFWCHLSHLYHLILKLSRPRRDEIVIVKCLGPPCWLTVQRSAKRRAPGLVNFVPAVAYHFCLALPAAFMQPGARLLAKKPSISCAIHIHYRVVRKNSFMFEFSRPLLAHQLKTADAQPISPDRTCVTELSRILFARPCTTVTVLPWLVLRFPLKANIWRNKPHRGRRGGGGGGACSSRNHLASPPPPKALMHISCSQTRREDEVSDIFDAKHESSIFGP